ncbi:MAG: methyltransferase domain-containing protein [Candidatus Nanopelagicales bacterium]
MLEHGREFAQICAEVLPLPEPVFEFGSFLVEDQPVEADLRSMFAGREFVGADMRPGPGVDRILDLHALDLPAGSVGTALLFDTLEHVERPWIAVAELHRVLAPDGVLVLTVPFNFAIHAHPDDYWRFTPAGVTSLLRPFAETYVRPVGLADDPVTVLAVATRSPLSPAVWSRLDAALAPRIALWNAIVESLPS